MKEQPRVECREFCGFGSGQVLLAALVGATAGAAFAYLTAPAAGRQSRQRLRDVVAGTKQGVERVPIALARATEAAREAFLEALDAQSAAVAPAVIAGVRAYRAAGVAGLRGANGVAPPAEAGHER